MMVSKFGICFFRGVFSGAFAVNFRGGHGCTRRKSWLKRWEFHRHPSVETDRGVERPLQASLRFHAQQQQTMRSAGVFKSPLKMGGEKEGKSSPQNPQAKMQVRFSRWWQLKYFLLSPRKLGKMNPFWRFAYFPNGLVQPPTSYPLLN